MKKNTELLPKQVLACSDVVCAKGAALCMQGGMGGAMVGFGVLQVSKFVRVMLPVVMSVVQVRERDY